MDSTVRLRPHHVETILRLSNQSSVVRAMYKIYFTFLMSYYMASNIENVVNYLRNNRNAKVEVVEGIDELCITCPEMFYCPDSERIRIKLLYKLRIGRIENPKILDKIAVDKYALEYNKTYRVSDLLKKIKLT